MEAIKTGVDPLNRLLGGWPKRVVTLLVGETGVGKSTLLMATALGAAIRGVKTFYIDVEGNLFGRPLNNVLIERADSSMDELMGVVNKLSSLPQSTLRDCLIIVEIVDSVTYHYHTLIRMAEDNAERDRLQVMLESIVYKLHSLTVKNNTATVISTWPTSFGEEESDFVGGFAVKTYTRVQIRMDFTEAHDVRRLTVVKHQDLAKYGSSTLISFNDLATNIFQLVGEVHGREAGTL